MTQLVWLFGCSCVVGHDPACQRKSNTPRTPSPQCPQCSLPNSLGTEVSGKPIQTCRKGPWRWRQNERNRTEVLDRMSRGYCFSVWELWFRHRLSWSYVCTQMWWVSPGLDEGFGWTVTVDQHWSSQKTNINGHPDPRLFAREARSELVRIQITMCMRLVVL